MNRVLGGWLSLLGVAILAPVALTVAVGSGNPMTLWSALAVMTGVQSAIALVFTLIAVARIRYLTSRLGIDGTMGAHRILGRAAVALATVHVLAVIADNPANVWLLDPSVAPGRAIAGTVALIVLVLIIGFAERRTIRHYERWRWAHRLGALGALILIALHIWGLNRLINVPAWAVLLGVLAAAVLATTAWRWMAPSRRRQFLVSEIWAESETASTISLAPVGQPLRFEAGQFAWLRLAGEPWSEDHPFSVSSAEDAEVLEFTFRHAGDWTSGPLRALRPGSPVWLDGPHGGMTLASARGAPGLVMVAAGVGLTPIVSILRTCADRGDGRPMHIVVPFGELLFRDELDELARYLDLRIEDALPRRISPGALGSVLPDRAWVPAATFYICGPPRMVDDTRAALRTMNIPADRIRSERFMAEVD